MNKLPTADELASARAITERARKGERMQGDYEYTHNDVMVYEKRIAELEQKIRDLKLCIADGLENRRLALLPDTEREVHFEELRQRIAELVEASMPLYDHEPSPKELRRFREAIDAAKGERGG